MDFVNFSKNQRVDADDLSYGMTMTQLNAARVTPASVLTSGESFVVNGFETSVNPAGSKMLLIKNGTAILAMRQGATLVKGNIITRPDASGGTTAQVGQTVDLTSFAAGSYAVYIRFNLAPAAIQSRTFWSGANAGSEYAQATPTRQQAVWEVRIEASSPGDEWLGIATLTLTASAITNLTDTRPLFFEGNGAAPSYANTWGSTLQRSDDRSTNGITDLRTFVDAVKQCIEDIKGPGLARWYSRYVAGMNVGDGFSSQTVSRSRICIGDANFFLQGAANGSTQLMLAFNYTNAVAGCLIYERSSNALTYRVNAVDTFKISSTGNLTITAGGATTDSALTVQGQNSTTRVSLRDRGTSNAATDSVLLEFGFTKPDVSSANPTIINVVGAPAFSLGTKTNSEFILRSESSGREFVNYRCPGGSTNADVLSLNAAFIIHTKNNKEGILAGLICAGIVNLDGTVEKRVTNWSFTVTKGSSGVYTFAFTSGTGFPLTEAPPVVLATPLGSGRIVSFSRNNATNITFTCTNTSGTPTDTSFSFAFLAC